MYGAIPMSPDLRSRKRVSLCPPSSVGVYLFAIALLGVIPLMLVLGFAEYYNSIDNFPYMATAQEQIFRPPLNTSSFYGYMPCEMLTYQYGTIISNETITTFSIS